MMIIRLAGGFGNQVFQLGTGLLLASKSKIKKIILDDSALNSYDAKRQNNLLSFFDLSKIDTEIVFIYNALVKFRIPKVIPFKLLKYPFISDRNFQTVASNPNKQFLLLDGYFQECLAQKDFDEEISILKSIFIQKNLEKRDGCVIHIRGGDFVKLGWDSVVPREYYIKAMNIMKKKYLINKFFIVTDDREYSKHMFIDMDFDYEFIGESMEEDFYLMGSFEKRILSSSTFSFWASVLSDNKESIIIAPEYWRPNFKRKIYMPNEIRINNE